MQWCTHAQPFATAMCPEYANMLRLGLRQCVLNMHTCSAFCYGNVSWICKHAQAWTTAMCPEYAHMLRFGLLLCVLNMHTCSSLGNDIHVLNMCTCIARLCVLKMCTRLDVTVCNVRIQTAKTCKELKKYTWEPETMTGVTGPWSHPFEFIFLIWS